MSYFWNTFTVKYSYLNTKRFNLQITGKAACISKGELITLNFQRKSQPFFGLINHFQDRYIFI